MIVACIVLGLFAIRAARKPAAQSPLIVHVPVEVPVVQEKVVTRVVYRQRPRLVRTLKRSLNTSKVDSTFAKSQKPSGPDVLAGFKPSEEVKLTVIKGGSANEK